MISQTINGPLLEPGATPPAMFCIGTFPVVAGAGVAALVGVGLDAIDGGCWVFETATDVGVAVAGGPLSTNVTLSNEADDGPAGLSMSRTTALLADSGARIGPVAR